MLLLVLLLVSPARPNSHRDTAADVVRRSLAPVHVTEMGIAKSFVLTHSGGAFTPQGVHTVLADLRLILENSDGTFSVNPLLANGQAHAHKLTFEHMISPYVDPLAKSHEAASSAMKKFVDRVFELNASNQIVTGFIRRILRTQDVSTWSQKIRETMLPPRPLTTDQNCVIHNDLSRAIQQGLHVCLVYDSLTREMFHNPNGMLKDVDEFFSSMLNEADISGIDFFFTVKFPSVVKPIKEFIKASATLASADKLLEEDEEEDEDEEGRGKMERLMLWTVKNLVISADPTDALRTNIREAALGSITVFKDRLDLVPLGDYPPSSKAGYVLASDRMFGAPSGCDSNCLVQFGSGKFTFTQSQMWMNLYSGWNLAFMFNADMVPDWWAKLVTPAVLEDTTGETYIIRRTIALWLALYRKTLRYDLMKSHSICHLDYKFDSSIDLQHIMGQETWKLGQNYLKLWRLDGTECPECAAAFEEYMSPSKLEKVLRFKQHISN